MKNPTISIIVPVYNIAPYIGKCLDSILAQTFMDFEVIVVNDGSTDLSGWICDDYTKKDKRIKVIHKKNGGLSSARNTGLNAAKAEYIGFVDGDDWIHKDMYMNLYNLCIETDSQIAVCSINREIGGKTTGSFKNASFKTMNNKEAMRQLFIGKLYRFAACNKLYNKKCFESVEFPVGRIHEDLATTYKAFGNAKNVVFSSHPGYMYVNRENSITTRKYSEKRLQAFIGWEEIIEYMDIHYPELSDEYISCFVYWSIDNLYYILNNVEDKDKKEEYGLYIRKYIKKYFKKIQKNNKLPVKYRYLTNLLFFNFKLFHANYKLKKIVS